MSRADPDQEMLEQLAEDMDVRIVMQDVEERGRKAPKTDESRAQHMTILHSRQHRVVELIMEKAGLDADVDGVLYTEETTDAFTDLLAMGRRKVGAAGPEALEAEKTDLYVSIIRSLIRQAKDMGAQPMPERPEKRVSIGGASALEIPGGTKRDQRSEERELAKEARAKSKAAKAKKARPEPEAAEIQPAPLEPEAAEVPEPVGGGRVKKMAKRIKPNTAETQAKPEQKVKLAVDDEVPAPQPAPQAPPPVAQQGAGVVMIDLTMDDD